MKTQIEREPRTRHSPSRALGEVVRGYLSWGGLHDGELSPSHRLGVRAIRGRWVTSGGKMSEAQLRGLVDELHRIFRCY